MNEKGKYQDSVIFQFFSKFGLKGKRGSCEFLSVTSRKFIFLNKILTTEAQDICLDYKISYCHLSLHSCTKYEFEKRQFFFIHPV